MVDLLTGQRNAVGIRLSLSDTAVHVPAHFDAQVLSAVGRLYRAGHPLENDASELLRVLRRAPLARHVLQGLIDGAWSRRESLRLVDALYVELAEQLGAPLITTDNPAGAKLSTSAGALTELCRPAGLTCRS